MRKIIIRSIQTNSGFLEQAPVSFSDKLTCVIGGRGTCKSTLIESLRFAFNSDPQQIERITSPVNNEPDQNKRISAPTGIITKTLGAGSVRCDVDIVDETTGERELYIVERETGSEARTLYADTRSSAGNRFDGELEVYSQGSLQEIASESGARLRLQLIDRPHRDQIQTYLQQLDSQASQLRVYGDQARVLRSELSKRQLQLRDLPQVRAELGRTVDDRPELEPTVEEKHEAYLRRRRTIEALSDLAVAQERLAGDIQAILLKQRDFSSVRDRLISLAPFEPRIDSLLFALDESMITLDRATAELQSIPVRASLDALSSEYGEVDTDYLAVRQQEQQLTENLKREDQLRRRLSELDAIEREMARLKIEQISVDEKRQELRSSVAATRDGIFELRVLEADRINRAFGDVVVLTMRRATHSAPYIEQLNDLLSGSRVRGQDEIARELAERVEHTELLKLVEAGDAQRIASILGRDLGQITRVVSYLRDHPDLYTLESAVIEDSLDITMFDRGESKPVEQLSGGQRATALLPLILRDATCPLVIDQPEDDLDNSFIYEVLVQTIRKLKLSRQLIFVTHNANIPVLGDAEAVVVMHMQSASKAGPPLIGSVETCKSEIIHLLEGGEDAFRSRDERYRTIVKAE